MRRPSLTTEEHQVARDAAARAVKFHRHQLRRRRKNHGSGGHPGYQGRTAWDVVNDYLGAGEDGTLSVPRLRRWHRIMDVACTLANQVIDRQKKGAVHPKRRVA